MVKVKTGCPLDCWDSCSMIATIENGVVTSLEGDTSHPITRGFLCGKGKRLKDRLYSPDRVLHPKKRVGDRWVRISWEQAIDEIAQNIRDAIVSYGHHSILHAYDWGSGTVLKNLNQRFFYKLGGCTETVGSLCWDAGLEAQRYDFGQARSHAPEDTLHAEAIVVWGRNVSVTNIHMMPWIQQAKQRGALLVTINPLATDHDLRADLCIAPRPGSDAVLALGALKICRDNGWLDTDFIETKTVRWEALSATLDRYTADVVNQLTDVQPHQLEELARIYGQTRPVNTLLGIGLQRHAGGGNAIRAIDALGAATGNIGVSGGGVNYANRAIPALIDLEALTGRGLADVREFTRGDQAQQILCADPPIQVMIVTRTNTVTQVPNTAALLKAYETIPCKVVIDMFMTPTAEVADYVLPCTNVLEDEDFVYTTMWHGYVTYINQAVPPIGEAKSDWEIFSMLADGLGFGEDMRQPASLWMERALRPLSEQYGIGLEELRKEGTIQLPVDPIPWADGRFLTESGRFEFASRSAQADGHGAVASYIPPHATGLPERDEEQLAADDAVEATLYPYSLLTIHPRISENSQHRLMPVLPRYPVVEISSLLAAETCLSTDDYARLWNDQAELVVRIRVVDRGHPYTIKLESGWWGQGVTINHFTKSHRADFGQQTAQYDCACNIEPWIDVEEGINQQ